MMSIDTLYVREPDVKSVKLKSISPSQHWYNKACAYKFILSNCPGVAKLPASPRAEIGIIAHKMLQWSASRRSIGVSLADAESKFDELLAQRESALASSPLTASIANLSKSCDVFLKRRHAAIANSERSASPQPPINGSKIKKVYTEESLTSPDGLVSGTMDSVYINGEEIHVVDKKTGSACEGGKIKESYREQLFLYAGLIDECLGQMPVRLSLIDGEGRRHDVPFDPCLVRANYQSAKEWILSVREEVERNPTHLEELAEPKPQNCNYCQFRPTCKPYWKASRLNSAGFPSDFASTIATVERLKLATLVNFAGFDSRLSFRVISTCLKGHPILTEIKQGDKLIISNVDLVGRLLEPTVQSVVFKDLR